MIESVLSNVAVTLAAKHQAISRRDYIFHPSLELCHGSIWVALLLILLIVVFRVVILSHSLGLLL